MSNTLIIIPARLRASRLDKKLLLDLEGQSVITRVCQRARELLAHATVVVATDSKEIYDHLQHVGIEVIMTRQSHRCGTERCAEVAAARKEEVIINLQGDEPFFDIQAVVKLIEYCHSNQSCAIGTLYASLDKNRNVDIDTVKVKIINGKTIDYQRVVSSHGGWYQHIGIYAFRRSTLLDIVKLPPSVNEIKLGLEQWRWLDHGFDIHALGPARASISIDTIDDLIEARNYLLKS